MVGSGSRMLEKCVFLQYCRDNAKTLPEPFWHCMITNLALAEDGQEQVHQLSKPYSGYDKRETEEKLRRAIQLNKPHTCAFIQKRLGFQGCPDCGVKAPVVHCILSKDEQVRRLVSEPLELEAVFADHTLELMAYAKAKLPAEYGKFKLKLKGKVAVRDFEAAVKKALSVHRDIIEDEVMPLQLEGIDLGGAVQPTNWSVSMDKGIRKFVTSGDFSRVMTISPCPIVIARRFENVDNDTEKLEVAFYRNRKWKRFVAPRSAVFNRSSLIGYADTGLPVTSVNANEIIAYLTDYETANLNHIPLLKSTERLGWLTDVEFFPYTADKQICFETGNNETSEIYTNLRERGSFQEWKAIAGRLRENPFARFLIAASFASVLLEPLNHRVFFVNIWHDSKSGKTAVIKLAAAAWGNPLKIMGSFNSTAVGMERQADTLRHIMYGIDERQLVNEKRLSIAQIVYGLSNGFGRIRGAKEGGIQELTSWRNIILCSGEEPLIAEDSHDGVNTRVLELHGQPVEDEELGKKIHMTAEKNYGFAGRIFVEYICQKLRADSGCIQRDYTEILDKLKRSMKLAKHLENAAAVCLGDYYSGMCIWDEPPDRALNAAVETGERMLKSNAAHEQQDIVLRAWQYMQDWCVANDRAFTDEAPVRYGIREGADTYYILKFAFDEALQKKNYPVEKCKTGFFERGYMPLFNGQRQKQKKTKGIKSWYYVIKTQTDDENEATPLI